MPRLRPSYMDQVEANSAGIYSELYACFSSSASATERAKNIDHLKKGGNRDGHVLNQFRGVPIRTPTQNHITRGDVRQPWAAVSALVLH